MYFFGWMQSTPLPSQRKSQPKGYVIGPVPFRLKPYFASRLPVRARGSLLAIARSSTYVPMYSQCWPWPRIQMSGSPLHGLNPMSRRQSARRSCHRTPEVRRPYSAFVHKQGVSFQITKFGASNEVKLLFCPGLEVCTQDVSGPCLQTIQFRKEDQ